ncbi:ATP-binding protein, partial [uncultured Bilophila sp.]
MLLRLIRGTGWPALGGMKAADPARHLVRPLLATPRADVEVFLRTLGVPWVEDASNRSDAFRRNRLRHHVLPLLRAENPSFGRSVRTLWELAREDERYWDGVLAPVFERLEERDGTLFLPRAAFVSLSRAARLRV